MQEQKEEKLIDIKGTLEQFVKARKFDTFKIKKLM